MNDLSASIDIGSNSALLLILKKTKSGFEVIENHSNVTGLGRDLDIDKVFINEAMNETLEVLKEYSQICKKHSVNLENVIATATEASRVAKNAPQFFENVQKETGIKVNIISSEAEAYYSTMGILIDEKITDDEVCIMDIGGASTEIIKVHRSTQEILHSFSMPVGAVRLNNWHAEDKRESQLLKVLDDYKDDLLQVQCKRLYCVAGTMTSVGNMYLNNKNFEEDEVNGLSFTVKEFNHLKEKYKGRTADQFLELFPFLGKRSKTIESGLLLASSLFDSLSSDDIYISTYGLRYGTALVDKIPSKYILN